MMSMAMEQVAHTKRYKLRVDADKNRLYFSLRGSGKDASGCADCIREMQAALRRMPAGFTALTDFTRFQQISPEWMEPLFNIHQMLITAGVSKEAEIHPSDIVLCMQLDSVAQHSGIDRQIFADRDRAEAWLDGEDRQPSRFLVVGTR